MPWVSKVCILSPALDSLASLSGRLAATCAYLAKQECADPISVPVCLHTLPRLGQKWHCAAAILGVGCEYQERMASRRVWNVWTNVSCLCRCQPPRQALAATGSPLSGSLRWQSTKRHTHVITASAMAQPGQPDQQGHVSFKAAAPAVMQDMLMTSSR